jgi:hypothetical protein
MISQSSRLTRPLCVGLPGLAVALVPLRRAAAHEIAGNRLFPATLGIDDPGVNDELSLPTVDSFKTGDGPSVRQQDFSAEFSKRITEVFAISVGTTSTRISVDPAGRWGWARAGSRISIRPSNTGCSRTRYMSS